jgi:hypothetical protein
MRLSFLLLSLLFAGGRVEGSLLMPRQPLDRPGDAFTGTLSSVDALSLTVRADSGAVVTFVVDDPMAVPPGLVPGTRVTVRHEPLEGGGRRVMRVGIASHPRDIGSTTEPPPDTSPSPRASRTRRALVPAQAEPSPPTPPDDQPPPARGSADDSMLHAARVASPPPSALPSATPLAAPGDAPKPNLPAAQAPPGLLHLLAFIVLMIVAGALLVFSASRT